MDTNSLLNLTVSQLKRAAALKEQIDSLNAELVSILGGESSVAGNGNGIGGKRQMSAAGRKRIGEAAKARWAKVRAAKGEVTPATSATEAPAKKRTMSPAAKKKIAAAQKARWAKFHAEKTKA